jgi:hypothetical protein
MATMHMTSNDTMNRPPRIAPWLVAAGAAWLLAGCAGLGAPASPAAPKATCNSAAAQFTVGQGFSPELERQARSRSGASIVRWLSPGQVVTKEFNEARLSLTLDGNAKVVRAACG